MTFVTIGLFAAALASIMLSMWGLFNKGRSVLCGLAGGLLLMLGTLGTWIAAAETQSLPWTLGYGTLAIMGSISLLRQFRSSEKKSIDTDLSIVQHGN